MLRQSSLHSDNVKAETVAPQVAAIPIPGGSEPRPTATPTPTEPPTQIESALHLSKQWSRLLPIPNTPTDSNTGATRAGNFCLIMSDNCCLQISCNYYTFELKTTLQPFSAPLKTSPKTLFYLILAQIRREYRHLTV